MQEFEIKLDERDIQRVRRMNLELKEAQESWNKAMKMILIDYMEDAKDCQKMSIVSMDFNTGVMKIKTENGGG